MNVSLARAGRAATGDRRLFRAVAPLALVIVTCLLVRPAVLHAVDVWSTTEEFGFGFLIIPVSGLLIWWRRRELRRSIGPGAAGGLPIVLGALVLYLFGQRAGINALSGLAVIPLLWGGVAFLWGWRAGRVLAFPIGFLAFGLGLFRGLLDSIGFAMQEITATGAAVFLQTIGVPVIRDGLVLRFDKSAFIVAEACSGMSSLLSLLALAALWTYIAPGTPRARAVILLSVAPLVLVANTMRVSLVLLIATWFGQETAVGFFHGASSLVLFGVALGGLLLVSRVVGWTFSKRAVSTPPSPHGSAA